MTVPPLREISTAIAKSYPELVEQAEVHWREFTGIVGRGWSGMLLTSKRETYIAGFAAGAVFAAADLLTSRTQEAPR